MRTVLKGKYIMVLPEDTKVDKTLLLGWSQRKNDPWIKVEDNLVNRIVLGLPTEVHQFHELPEYTDQLKDYQINDVVKALDLRNHMNSNPMGLGKTVETIRYLEGARRPEGAYNRA